MHPDVVVVIGTSGSGKSALVARLAAARLVSPVPTWTTRPSRPDERRGSPNHRFVDDAGFDRLVERDAFLGVVRLPGLPHRYGLPRLLPAGDARPVVVARAPFVAAIRAHLPAGPTIQVERPAGAALLALCERATSIEEVGARLRDAEAERRLGRRLADHVVINDGSLDALVERVRAVAA